MTDYGYDEDDEIAGFIISSAESGGAPSGDIVRLIGKKWSMGDNPGQKITSVAGGVHFATKTGEYEIKVTWTDVIIVKGESGSNNTKEFNNIIAWIRDHHKAAKNPFYIWIYNFVDDDWIKIGYAAGVETDYLKCYCDKNGLQTEGEDGNIYYIKRVTFIGCEN